MLIPSTRLIFFIFFSRSSSLESAIVGTSEGGISALAVCLYFVPPPCCVLRGSNAKSGLIGRRQQKFLGVSLYPNANPP